MKREPVFGTEGLLAFWNSLTPDDREALVHNIEEFHATITSLKNRGIIETDKNLTHIDCKENTEEITRLIELRDLINASYITINLPEKPKETKKTPTKRKKTKKKRVDTM